MKCRFPGRSVDVPTLAKWSRESILTWDLVQISSASELWVRVRVGVV